MNIEKPGFVEVTIDKARPDELPKIIGIYRQHNGNCKMLAAITPLLLETSQELQLEPLQ